MGLVLLVLAAFFLPLLININRYRSRIAADLGAGLGRPVQVGDVHLTLLPAPGLTASEVVIGEDPSFGPEPFARMSELRATLRLRSLWTGRLSFSSIVFIEPSLNLSVRPQSWNVESLLRRGGAGGAAGPAADAVYFPYLEFRDGRINFKEGDVKNIFFFSNVQAAVFAQNGRLGVRFRGQPSRTDRTLTGAGEIRAEGEFGPRFSDPLSLRVRLMGAFLSDLLVLVRGSESGVQGTLGLDMQVSGHPRALRVQGRLEAGRLHRADLPPPLDLPPLDLDFSGLADFPARRLDLAELRTAQGTVAAFGTIRNFLRSQDDSPAWDLQVRFTDADAGPLFATSRNFSPRLSKDLRVEGRLNGAVRLTGPSPSGDGNVKVTGLALSGPGMEVLRAPEARLTFDGPMIRLEPVSLPLGDSHTLTLGLAVDWTSPVRGARTIEVSAAGNDLAIGSITALASALGLHLPQIPDGRLSLNAQVEVERGSAPVVSGWAKVARMRIAPAWLTQPVVLQTARAEFKGSQMRVDNLVATIGDSTLTGAFRGPLSRSGGQWQGELRVNEAGTAFFAGLYRAGQAPPAFLAALDAKGTLAAGRFRVRGVTVENLRAGFTLAGRRLTLRDVQAAFPIAGSLRGAVQLDFAGPIPEYSAQAQVNGAALESFPLGLAAGPLTGKFEWNAAGRTAAEINDSMRLRGSFTGRDWIVRSAALGHALQITRIRQAAADVVVQNRHVRFTRLDLRGDGPELEATGLVGFDRDVRMDFRSFLLTGSLDDPHRQAGEMARGRTQ